MHPAQHAQDVAAVLAALQPLLQRQSRALRDGDADALPAIDAALRQHLALLSRLTARGPLPASARDLLLTLQSQAAASQTMLARRLSDVRLSLEALGAASPDLQEAGLHATYGRGGMAMYGGGRRSGGFARA